MLRDVNRLLAMAFLLFLLGMAGGTKSPLPLTFTVAPVGQETFRFGEVTETAFTMKNVSDRALVALTIWASPYGEKIETGLAQFQPGSLIYDDHAHVYMYYPTKGETDQRLYAGLLLPGQTAIVHADFRPLQTRELFAVLVIQAEQAYDGTPASLLPLTVFFPDPQPDGWVRYAPVTAKTLQQYARGWPWRERDIPPGTRPKVLIPSIPEKWELPHNIDVVGEIDDGGAAKFQKMAMELDFTATIPFTEPGFFYEAARQRVAEITGRPLLECWPVFSRALGGYLVYEVGKMWLLTEPGQQVRGEWLPFLPSSLVFNVDAAGDAGTPLLLQNFAAPAKAAKLWDTYPITSATTGTGRYITLNPKNLKAFLRDLQAHGGRLDVMEIAWDEDLYSLATSETNAGIPTP